MKQPTTGRNEGQKKISSKSGPAMAEETASMLSGGRRLNNRKATDMRGQKQPSNGRRATGMANHPTAGVAATKRADVATTEQPAAGEGPNNEQWPKSANDGGQIVAVPNSLDSGG